LLAVLLFGLSHCSAEENTGNDAALPDLPGADSSLDTASDSIDGQTLDAPAEADGRSTTYPPFDSFHKVDSPQKVKASAPYSTDEPVFYRTTEQLPSLDVRVLSAAGGKLWAGTAAGLFLYDEQQDLFTELPLGEGVSQEIRVLSDGLDPQGRLAVVTSASLLLVDPATAELTFVADNTVPQWSTAAFSGATLFLGTTDSGLWAVALDQPSLQPYPVTEQTFPVSDLVTDADDRVWLATPSGLKRWDGKELTVAADVAGGGLPDDDVRAVAHDAATGSIVAGTATGISRLPTGNGPAQMTKAGPGKLPYDHVMFLDAQAGRVLIGHDLAATWVEFSDGAPELLSRVDHYAGGRWLPGQQVRSVAIDAKWRLWIATEAGLSRIEWVEHTFEEKAAYFEDLLDQHFWRMDGFVAADAGLDEAWNPTTWSVGDFDNDGLWTQMQVGAWCYAYAATGDEQYYQQARKAMDVMMLEIDVPAGDFEKAGLGRGFVTRSLAREDEGPVFESKAAETNWHKVEYEDGHTYYWKDDTSSDEVDGHFFGYPLFYDLCAKTDEERKAVADHAADLARYIIKGGYLLLDLDGQKTTHGHWSPETIGAAADGLDKCMEEAALEPDADKKLAMTLLCGDSYYGGGWLNGTEILGTLLATYHMTGDTMFYDEYRKLLDVHHYGNMIMPHKETATVFNPAYMNHSDHELAMLAYHTLIRYEPDDELRQKWIDGFLAFYEPEKIERNPLWAAFVALLAGPEHADLDAALQSLREMPFDRRDWLVDNTHRKDAGLWPDDRHDNPQFDTVFAYDEIRTIWWNGNLHTMVDGGNPKSVSGPMAWLLPYWALRYAGVIGE
jgi:hypothetical protein